METKHPLNSWNIMHEVLMNRPVQHAGVGKANVVFGSQFAHPFESYAHQWVALQEDVIESWTIPVNPEEKKRQAELLEDQIRSVFGYGKKLEQFDQRLDRIEKLLEAIFLRIAATGPAKGSVMVPIQTLAPEPYKLLQPLTVVVTEADDEYEAAFFDAGIFASGDTEEDAVSNLKETMIDTFDRLSELNESQLGPGPTRQKQVLEFYIRKP